MSRPRLQLRSKKDQELKTFATAVIKAMRESEYFAEHQEIVEEVAEDVEDFSTALTDQEVQEAQLRAATQRKKASRKRAEAGLTSLAALVMVVAKGNPVVIASTNMELHRERSRVGDLPAPDDLRAVASAFEGACDLTWEVVDGASVYEVQFKLQPADAPWQQFALVTPSKARVTGLTPGVVYYFRVRAIGTAGPGVWSDPALRRAP